MALHSLLIGWRVQRRVWGALILREIQTRWGRRNLGFAWLFAEPLVFAFPVLTVWHFIRAPFEGGVPIIPFLWSGYLPLLIFRHVGQRAMGVLKQNAAMMYHRWVTPLDICVATIGLEAFGNLISALFSFVVFYRIDVLQWPENIGLVIGGFLYMAWWSLAIGVIVVALTERSEIVQHIWSPVSYIYMPLSGCFYMAAWLPAPIRNVALNIMPSLQCYEMIRAGLFGSRFETYYDVEYLTYVLATLSLIGLWLLRHVREYIELQ